MNQSDFQKVGYVVREKGLKGEIKVSFEAFFLDYLYENDGTLPEHFFVDVDGSMIPYFIEQSNLKSQPIILKFEDVDDKDTAQKLRARELFLPKNLFKTNELPDEDEVTFWDYIIGFQVFALHEQQILGAIEDIFYLPEHELAQLFCQKKELLLPLNEEYIHEIDEVQQKITVNLPEGYLEVFLT